MNNCIVGSKSGVQKLDVEKVLAALAKILSPYCFCLYLGGVTFPVEQNMFLLNCLYLFTCFCNDVCSFKGKKVMSLFFKCMTKSQNSVLLSCQTQNTYGLSVEVKTNSNLHHIVALRQNST